jgi:hypothetical protein
MPGLQISVLNSINHYQTSIMLKKMSKIMALAIMTILTAYILAPILSNQAFALSMQNGKIPSQVVGTHSPGKQPASNSGHVGHPVTALNSGKTLAGHEPQRGNVNTPTNPVIKNPLIQYYKMHLAPKKITIGAMKAGASKVIFQIDGIPVETIECFTCH